MTWFSLPMTQATNKAAFADSESAARWLARQPQANAPAMLAEFVAQIHAFNATAAPARERFKTLEVLRKPLFAANAECQRRFENKPLPLLPTEQMVLDTVRQLWRASTVGYLHCLRACLDGEASIARHGAKVAHRVLASLRMEQTSCYLGGAELGGEFWSHVHAVFACAEQLGVVREPVADRLLGETSESTVGGQYAMALMLHSARPFSLTRGQFVAVSRWLARWRELALVHDEAESGAKAACIAIDLAQPRPQHEGASVPRVARWLVVTDVLGKIGQRIKSLAAGQSPESLKLGSGLSSEACAALLGALSEHLRTPQQTAADGELAQPAAVAAGLENIHRALGGTGLDEPADRSAMSSLSADQIAIFGHVVRETTRPVAADSRVETWRLSSPAGAELHLLRPAGGSAARLGLGGLLAIRLPVPPGDAQGFALAVIGSLYARNDLSLCVTATLLSAKAVALVAQVTEKASGKVSLCPAFVLPGQDRGGSAALVLPVGVSARALSIRFYKDRIPTALELRLVELIERGSDHERWTFAKA